MQGGVKGGSVGGGTGEGCFCCGRRRRLAPAAFSRRALSRPACCCCGRRRPGRPPTSLLTNPPPSQQHTQPRTTSTTRKIPFGVLPIDPDQGLRPGYGPSPRTPKESRRHSPRSAREFDTRGVDCKGGEVRGLLSSVVQIPSLRATPRARSRTLRWIKALEPPKTTTAKTQITARAP